VEAKFKNGKRWFKGEIQRENRDGTYEVLFEDGDRDLAVPRENINLSTSGATANPEEMSGKTAEPSAGPRNPKVEAPGLQRGSKVEAKFKNGKRWFKGEIQRDNRDGTYEVLFNDGDRDLAVPRANIKLAGESAVPHAASASLNSGTKVEAKFKNGKRWFKGEIQRKNRDGTYEVLFDDGDRDLAVPRDNVKLITTRVQPASSDSKEASAGSGSRAQAASRPSRVSESSGSRFGVSRRPARPRPASRSRVGSSKPRTSLRDRVLARATSGSGAAQPASGKPTRPTRPAASKK